MGRKTLTEDVKSGRIGRLDDHTMGYYRRVSDKIQEGFENAEEQDMFLRNVFAELDGSEIKLSQNQTVSRILEMLFPLASQDQLTHFLRGMISDLETTADDRFASHVLQSVLSQALKYVGESDEIDELEMLYVKVSNEMVEHLDHVMMQTYASHVLRSVIASLAGIQVADNVSRSKLSRGQQQKDISVETKIILSTPPKCFQECLVSLTEGITTSEHFQEFFTSPTAGPVLDVLLLSLQQSQADWCHRLTRSVLKQSDLLSKGNVQDSEERPLPNLMIHPIGSHLMEVTIKVMTDDILQKLISRSFKGRLIKVALHGVANFVLQRLLERTKHLPVFEELFDELIEHIESILAVNHMGVIQRLAAGCVSHTSKQVPFLQALLKAFHCYEPRERQVSCVPVFSSMVTYDIICDADEETKETSASLPQPSITLQGSLLLQQMLKFTKNGTIINSFLAMSSDTLVSMAMQPAGSYLLEAFMTSSLIGEKKKDQFVVKMKDNCFQIACSKCGSRSIEGIFKAASIKSKFVIAEDLAEREAQLLSHTFGRFVHRNLSIGHFQARRQDWKDAQLKKAQKRKLFADIVGEPPSKPKPSIQDKREGEYCKKLAELTGSQEMGGNASEQEEAGGGDGDEIAAIFSSLPHRGKKKSKTSMKNKQFRLGSASVAASSSVSEESNFRKKTKKRKMAQN